LRFDASRICGTREGFPPRRVSPHSLQFLPCSPIRRAVKGQRHASFAYRRRSSRDKTGASLASLSLNASSITIREVLEMRVAWAKARNSGQSGRNTFPWPRPHRRRVFANWPEALHTEARNAAIFLGRPAGAVSSTRNPKSAIGPFMPGQTGQDQRPAVRARRDGARRSVFARSTVRQKDRLLPVADMRWAPTALTMGVGPCVALWRGVSRMLISSRQSFSARNEEVWAARR